MINYEHKRAEIINYFTARTSDESKRQWVAT